FVEMGKFAARVLEEELANQDEDECKEIYGEDSGIGQDGRRVRSPKNKFVRNKELQLAHEPEAKRKKDGDGDEQRVGDHWESPRNRILFFPGLSNITGSGKAAGRQPRPSSTPGVSRITVAVEGCGAG